MQKIKRCNEAGVLGMSPDLGLRAAPLVGPAALSLRLGFAFRDTLGALHGRISFRNALRPLVRPWERLSAGYRVP